MFGLRHSLGPQLLCSRARFSWFCSLLTETVTIWARRVVPRSGLLLNLVRPKCFKEHATPSMATDHCNRLIWVDMEMTGLDIETDQIMEVACVVTDDQLNVVAEVSDLIVHVADDVLDNMGGWCKKHHGQSGLTAACRASKLSVKEVDQALLQFVQLYTPAKMCPLAGNSVHADKRFIDKYMPLFSNHLHYRIVDVSTVKELCRRWYPDQFSRAPIKKGNHRAIDDILESIEELKYYRKTIFTS